jgi:hypothetical protein
VTIEALRKFSYELNHSPNCPKPFRLHVLTGGVVGYGMTVDEAAQEVLDKMAHARFVPVFRDLWAGL